MLEYFLYGLLFWAVGGALTVALYIRNVLRDTVDQYPLFSSWVKVFVFWPFPLFCWFIIRSVENMKRYEEDNGK